MTPWLAIAALLAALFTATVASAAPTDGGAEEWSVDCPMINIGTPDNPRFVPDPGCSSPG